MPALFTKFDPQAFLESEILGFPPAKAAKVAKVENVRGIPTLATLATLADPLGVSPNSVSAPYARAFAALEARCPDYVPADRWQQAVEDGRRFLAKWGKQAQQLGWTAGDLFSLHEPPAKPHPSYSRLSRYDETGLIWLLQGRSVVALTEATAAIENPTGAVTVYRKNKPALGPVGDCLDDFR
jgi:hypothetical protein